MWVLGVRLWVRIIQGITAQAITIQIALFAGLFACNRLFALCLEVGLCAWFVCGVGCRMFLRAGVRWTLAYPD